ncbi:MAG: PAS domain-containing protein [Hyphomicrobiaceae bacterium]|nr:MAG: PAS domain-containing protein [Hyphomicrobiaceae bacterium]
MVPALSRQMKLKTSQALYGYWNEVRRGRLAPRRFDIEPSRISQLLPETFILERVEGDRFIFRLAGTRICEAFGREFRGTNLLDLFAGKERSALERLLAIATGQGAVVVLTLSAASGRRRPVPLEMVLLPLLHTDESVSRFLCSLAEVEPADWLGYEPVDAVLIEEHELIWPDGRPYSILSRLHRPGAFAPLPRLPLARPERKRFRVVEGGLSGAAPAGARLPDVDGSDATVPKADGT